MSENENMFKTLRPLSAFFLFCASGKDSHSQAGSAIKTPDIFIHSGGRWIHQADLGARHLLCQRENCALPPGKHCPTQPTFIFILWYLHLSVFHYKISKLQIWKKYSREICYHRTVILYTNTLFFQQVSPIKQIMWGSTLQGFLWMCAQLVI